MSYHIGIFVLRRTFSIENRCGKTQPYSLFGGERAIAASLRPTIPYKEASRNFDSLHFTGLRFIRLLTVIRTHPSPRFYPTPSQRVGAYFGNHGTTHRRGVDL